MGDFKLIADRLVAHRGFQKAYPENTLLSMQKAIEVGAHFIETDIQFSADLEPLLFHDDDLARMTGRNGEISDYSRPELQCYSVYEPHRLGEQFRSEKMAGLDQLVELLLAAPQVTAFIELKETPIQRLGVELVLRRVLPLLEPIRNRAVIISFHLSVVQAARERNWPQVGAVLTHRGQLTDGTFDAIRPDFLFADIKKLPATGDLSLPYGRLVVYEVADPAVAVNLYERGVDMIETFDIQGLLTAISGKMV